MTAYWPDGERLKNSIDRLPPMEKVSTKKTLMDWLWATWRSVSELREFMFTLGGGEGFGS